jgi:hypothetical protein
MITDNKLTPEEAIEVFSNLAKAYRGSLDEHITIQAALNTAKHFMIIPPGGHLRSEPKTSPLYESPSWADEVTRSS